MTNIDIVTSIDRRLTEARAEIAQLEGAREALINGDAAAVTPKARRVSRKTMPPKTVRRGGEVVPAGKLTALLDGSAGMSTSELARATDGRPVRSSVWCAIWSRPMRSGVVGSVAGPGGI